MDTRHGFAEVNDTRLYYEVAGTGEPLVLIHGFTLDTRMWDDQFAPFAEHYRVVRYDARGFGQSAPIGDLPYTHADDLATLLTYLGIASAAIVGLSMGGRIAVDFALTYPAMTRALIPVDAALGGYHFSEEANAKMRAAFKAARTEGINAAKARWLDLPLFTPAREQAAVGARLSAMVADYSCAHWTNGDPERHPDPPAVDRLGEIASPTLVVLGERDIPDFHGIADRITAQVPNARKVVISGVGHMANMEAPEQFNGEVLDFLANT
jgi:3-oxoadipate enol-lactonase